MMSTLDMRAGTDAALERWSARQRLWLARLHHAYLFASRRTV
ncbi:hypothetical protein QTI66_31050 [Variovorax sp. J22R133]|nr:hypothetical protein [Variovorax sp. J22R133]MDM0116585.1 hypothetical protein [Variovorax sp. J22R133]